MSPTPSRILLLIGSLACGSGVRAAEMAVTGDGRQVEGELRGDHAAGFHFQPLPEGRPVPLGDCRRVLFRAPSRPERSSSGAYRVLLAGRGRISGRLGCVSRSEVVLREGPSGLPVRITRASVRALVQRGGEVQVLEEGFETLDSDRWVVTGHPELADQPVVEGRRCLRLPGGGSAVQFHPGEGADSGRLELALQLRGEGRHRGERALIALSFRGPVGPASLGIVLGWEDDLLGIGTAGTAPPLAVQPLLRVPGWHRLTVRFGHGRTDVAIDGDELAHGAGIDGPLESIRLATVSTRGRSPAELALLIDDLRLVRFVTAAGLFEADPAQDDLRLVGGNQVFGSVRSATAQGITCELDGRPTRLDWSRVEGLYFRRRPGTAGLLDGEWVRVSWRGAPGNTVGDRDEDEVEGVLNAVAAEGIEMVVPYLVSPFRVPRDRLLELVPLGRLRRQWIDPGTYHLGHAVVPRLDPPQPEGRVLEIAFELEAVPDGPATLALDVVQILGIEGDPVLPRRVRDGEPVARAVLNDRALGPLNRHVAARDEASHRVRLPIPPGLLHAGRNRLRLEQTGLEDDPGASDNLGLLGVALEWPTSSEASQP